MALQIDNMRRFYIFICLMILSLSTSLSYSAPKTKIILPISPNRNGFEYIPDARGNKVPDYSYCGYKASNENVPMLPIKAFVPYISEDATESIQTALDYVASLPLDANGFRGAVLLDTGRFEISRTLWIKASGVVLRGSGAKQGGTELFAAYTDRTTLIRICGQEDMQKEKALSVSDTIVTVGSMLLTVPNHSYKVGDRILIQPKPLITRAKDRRPGNNIEAIESPWSWERSIVEVKGQTLTLDAPITYEMSDSKGGAQVQKITWPGRIENCGLENMALVSTYDQDNLKDENHAWIALAIENTRDAWVRQVLFRHFAGSAVFVAETASRVTIEDCLSLEPISEIGGQRRYSFYIKGAQCLCQRIQAEYGYHDFAVGAYAAGPNAFVQCWSILPYGYSGAIESSTSGVLFDICCVDGEALRFDVPNMANVSSSWAACNSMMWNSSASIASCTKPDNGQNWAYGVWGGFNGHGFWHDANNYVSPWSLYYAQLSARKGSKDINESKLIPLGGGGASSMEDARLQTIAARKPLIMLSAWMDSLAQKYPIDIDWKADQATSSKTSSKTSKASSVYIPSVSPKSPSTIEFPKMTVQHGVLVCDGKILSGRRQNPSWWRGSMTTPAEFDPHIVRYALGPEGYGVVDDLDAMTDQMLKKGVLMTDFNYALWYDRRRDDHERTPRINGEVRPPLYELPFARSGEGRAWDGLSKYDLTKWNNWYWNRLKQYADLADEKSLILLYQHYFQHNIIEAGAHWADFPWRSANNVNETGFPEPTPYAGNKRVFMSEHFYDETHPQRRALHRNYIRKCLDNFADNTNVIHSISAEFTGPLHFTQFWVDVIAEWEAETGKKVLVALSAPKNVQDAILQDAKRAALIDVIDIQYWYVNAQGKEYAPEGGLNLSPRQFERIEGPGATSAEQVYQMVRQYRQAYPDKAVVYSAESYQQQAWAAFMAGASLCSLPQDLPVKFKQDAAKVQPIEAAQWTLANPSVCYMVYPADGKVQVDLSKEKGVYKAQYLDLRTGKPLGKIFQVKAGTIYESEVANGLLWLYR